MSYLVSTFLVLIFSFIALGKDFNYQLKGNYQLDPSKKQKVEYTLRWAEKDGEIIGEYSDNYFAETVSVSGTSSELGRNFNIVLPEDKNGVRAIKILISDAGTKRTGTTIPVSLITRDRKGNPLQAINTGSRLTATKLLAQKQEEECIEGFGALRGFCGVYAGLVSEDVDRQNKCHLLYADAIRLELNPESMLILHLGEVNQLISNPSHEIGRLPVNPESRKIDVMSRACHSLPAIESSSNHCKRLNITGEFYSAGEDVHFRGHYTIYDEHSKNTCRYTLSLDR